MDDKKLLQECWVVLEDCFKGLGASSGGGCSTVTFQSEPSNNSVNFAKRHCAEPCVTDSNRLQQCQSNDKQREIVKATPVCIKSAPLSKSLLMDTQQMKIIPTKKTFVSLSTGQRSSSLEDLKAQNGGIKRKSLINVFFNNDSKSVVARSSSSASGSSDHLILDPKTRKLFNPEALTQDLLLSTKDRTVSGTIASAGQTSCSTEGINLNQSGASSGKILDSETENVSGSAAAAKCPNDGKMYAQGTGSSKELILHDGKVYTNPSHTMPVIGITVEAGIGLPLPTLSAKCVLTGLDGCQNFITTEYAEFCSAVVKTSTEPKSERVILPIKDNRVVQLMQIKWNSKSSVKQVSVSDCLDAPPSTSNLTNKCKNDFLTKQSCDVNSSEFLEAAGLSQSSDKCSEGNQASASNQNYDRHTEANQAAGSVQNSDKKCLEDSQAKELQIYNDEHKNEKVVSILKRKTEQRDPTRKWALKCTKMSLLDNDRKKALLPQVDEIDSRTNPLSSGNVKRVWLGHQNTSNNPIDSDDEEMRTVPQKTAFEVPVAPYDPDDTRGIDGHEEKALDSEAITQKTKLNVLKELRRLDVAVFDMPTSFETVVCKLPDTCQLGCVCGSLLSRVVQDNCGLEKCMFGCVCRKKQKSDKGNDPYAWAQKKAKKHLAKEQRHFKQTVLRSDKDDLIIIDRKRKREIKLPKKWEDFLSGDDLRQSKAMKDEESPNIRTSQPKQAKRLKIASNVSPLLPTDKKDTLNTSAESTDKEPEPLNSVAGDSARTAFYDYKSSKSFQIRQIREKPLESEADQSINLESQLFKIVSTQSLDQKEWEDSGIKESVDSMNMPSCSFLFDTEYIKKFSLSANILPWDALWNDIDSNAAFVWCQETPSKPKIYLTNSPAKPHPDCCDLKLLDATSEAFTSLPIYIQALKTGYSSFPANKVGWVLKYIKSHWMIVGHIQRNQLKRLSQPQQNQTSGETSGREEVDILPSINEDPSRWWVMDLSQNFDLIYFMDFRKALTKRQLNTMLRLSNEYPVNENKVYRILLNRQMPKLNATPVSFPDFGAYSTSSHPNKVFIGPYPTFREPKFQVFRLQAAPNGKTQYVGVPLFYCGAGECVRVTSQGVLSLHSEPLPIIYVQGFWYQSCGNNLRETCENPIVAASTCNQSLNDEDESDTKILDVTDDQDEITEITDVGDNNQTRATVETDTFSNFLEEVVVDEDSSSVKEEPVEEESNNTELQLSHLITQPQDIKENTSVTSLDSKSFSESGASSQVDCASSDESDNQTADAAEKPKLPLIYMIPDEPKIGYVTLTHLPGGAISVPHFTELGSLKFFRQRSEIVGELNRLIHTKLSCLSKKCSDFLQNNGVCTCVKWRFAKSVPKVGSLPKFTPDIFNGFFMFTKYGLLDLRSTEERILQELGKDWVEWMKNDQIRIKLNNWKSKEEQDILEKKLKKILSSSRDLPLQKVLLMATDAIAKLKAEEQLLDYESQSQKLMKETLISSLCRKLDGIPVNVVPRFLEHLEFSLLWEVLECMNSRKTFSITLEKQVNPPKSSSTHDDHLLPTHNKKVKRKGGQRRCRSRRANAKVVTKGATKTVDPETRLKALAYMKRLQEEIRQEEMQKLAVKVVTKEEPTSSDTLSPETKAMTKDHLKRLQEEIRQEKEQKLIEKQKMDVIQSQKGRISEKKSQTTPKLVTTRDKEGLACKMSAFSRINIRVEEGGIKYSPTSPPLPLSPCSFRGSPEKPSILRKSKGLASSSAPAPTMAPKQARKQVLSNKQGEEPVYLDDTTSPSTSDFDPISSLCITSVVSEAKIDAAPCQDIDKLSPQRSSSELSGTWSQGSQDTTMINSAVDDSRANQISSLRMANVFSTRNVSPNPPHRNEIVPDSQPYDPVSLLRISVKSGVEEFSSLLPAAQVSSVPTSSPFLVTNTSRYPKKTSPNSKRMGRYGSVLSEPIVIRRDADSDSDSPLPNERVLYKLNANRTIINASKTTKVSDAESVQLAENEKMRTIRIVKKNNVVFQPKIPAKELFTRSILNKHANSMQLMEKHSSSGSASSSIEDSSK